MSDKLYKVGIYIRLSLENTAYRGEDSMSIENQQAMLRKFISMILHIFAGSSLIQAAAHAHGILSMKSRLKRYCLLTSNSKQ